MSSPVPISPSAIDRDNPWPGLASFTEDASGFFFGREKETDELSRLVRRQTLTVLFGQSGLGKSSLIQAGLFPLLRESDHLPLYLRLDHAASTPAPAEQVKAALTAAFAAEKAEAPAFRADETLWEYFHRKDVDIWSAKNRLLTPVLAFDQFEEIFTLGRADDACSERSRAFLAELACLVENRPPAAVKEKLNRGELDPARFNFSKPSCQVILSLREDFLPDLEGLKREMPALIHNRLRLKKLSGTQALDIVTKPAPHLLAEGVAEKIVEFVAGARGGSAERLAELDVEPPLLSVICRELNDRRRARGQAQITADLVSGNRREILHNFYERSVADLPAPMRAFIEDHLLTKSGFRDNLALETAIEFPGVTRPWLDTLVARRLLRIEDRLGVQRVELTHDVLADVIRALRDERRGREAIEAEERRRLETEAELARAKAEQTATRRSLWRARMMLAFCAVLAAAAIYGFWAASNARTRAEKLATIADQSRANAVAAETKALAAEAKTEAQRKLADTARGQAEGLASFLLADFFDELEPTGRFDTLARLAEQTVNYYAGLPAELRSPLTARRRALAVTRQGAALRGQGKFDEGDVMLEQSVAEFEKLVASGDESADTTQSLATALLNQTATARLRNDPAATRKTDERAVELLRPLAAAPNSSTRVRKEYARALRYLGADQLEPEAQLNLLEEARRVLTEASASDLSDLFSAAAYADSTRAASVVLTTLNRDDEAERYRNEALSLVERVLAQHPGVLLALITRALLERDLSGVEAARFHHAAALELALKAEKTHEEYLRFNPSDSDGWARLTLARGSVASLLAQRGRIHDAVDKLRSAVNVLHEQKSSAEAITYVPAAALTASSWEAQLGHRDLAEQALAEGLRLRRELEREHRSSEVENEAWRIYSYGPRERALRWSAGDFAAVITQAKQEEQSARLLVQPQLSEGSKGRLETERQNARRDAAMANVMLGHYAEAEASLREQLAASKTLDSGRRVWLALAIARQNRGAETREILAPALATYRDRQAKGDDGLTQQQNLVRTLYVQALAQPADDAGRAQRRASLDEAAKILDGFTDEAKQLAETGLLQNWVVAERAK